MSTSQYQFAYMVQVSFADAEIGHKGLKPGVMLG